MKKLILALFTITTVAGSAQDFTSLTLREAQTKAQEEGKIILVDASRPNTLTPEKLKAEKQAIALPEIKAFAGENIIAIRVDMFSDAGKEFAPMLQMNMYPTYAYIMANGDLITVMSPYVLQKDPSKFAEIAKKAVADAKERMANTREIDFTKESLEDLMKRAQKENKLIFIDAYTDNCQPCMKMAKNIFTQNNVADFYNSNFLNIKLNLSREYKELADKYKISGYPTFLFIDGKGELIHMASGYTPAEQFIDYGKEALKVWSVNFEHLTWNEVLEKSRKENKPIFVDCYTVWCGPCKQMANVVFKEKKVAEYFNTNYINVKVDMEKGEGITLKNRYGVKAYPTFLFIDSNGEEIHRIVGSMPGDLFIKKSMDGMSKGGVKRLRERYNAGDRESSFIKEYLDNLEAAYLVPEASAVVTEMFKTEPMESLKDEKNWQLFEKYIDDVNSPVFDYVYTNKDEFRNLFGDQRVNQKLYMVWSIGSRSFVKKDGDNVSFDKDGFESYVKRMKKSKVDKFEEIVLNAKMFNAEQTDNWKEYVKIADSRVKKGIDKLEEFELYNWGIRIDQRCKDKELRGKACEWFKKMLPVLEEREARKREEVKKSGGMMAMSMVNYTKEFRRLIESLSK